MKDNLTNNSVLGFSFLLSSKAPVPGGGSAAALIGALSAALCEMAGNLTIGKKKYAAYEDDQKRMIAACEILRERFLQLIEADAAAFEPLSKAYALPKDDPNYAETMTAVTLKACQAPYQMLECCCETIQLLEEMLEKCSRLMISDVGCGAVAAEAAMKAAYLNVIINTQMLPENEEAILLERNSEAMLNIWLPRAKTITDSVTESLRRK